MVREIVGEFESVSQAAKRAGVSPSLFYSMIRSNRIEGFKVGGRLLMRTADTDKFIIARSHKNSH